MKSSCILYTLIDIISIRIEPSEPTAMLYDYPCVSFNSTHLSAFTFFCGSAGTEHLSGCNMKELVQIVEAFCCCI